MDFVVLLPRTLKSYYSIWVNMDRLTKSAHFIPVKSTCSAEDYIKIFIYKIVCHHGIPLSIISDQGAQFTSSFLSSFQDSLGTIVKLSTSFYPQTDGEAEHTIQTLEDMLRPCVFYFKGSWYNHFPFVEFSYNNSFHTSISMSPCEALYGMRSRFPIGWFAVHERHILCPDFIYKTFEKFNIIRNRFQTTNSWQRSYADNRRRDLEIDEGDKVYLKISPMKGVVRFAEKG